MMSERNRTKAVRGIMSRQLRLFPAAAARAWRRVLLPSSAALATSLAWGGTKTQFQDCYVYEQDGSLVFGNDRIERVYQWNGGNLVPVSIAEKRSRETIALDGSGVDFSLGAATLAVR